MAKEIDLLPVFRYANACETSINLAASGRVNMAPFVTGRFRSADAVEAFEYARKPRPDTCKIGIDAY